MKPKKIKTCSLIEGYIVKENLESSVEWVVLRTTSSYVVEDYVDWNTAEIMVGYHVEMLNRKTQKTHDFNWPDPFDKRNKKYFDKYGDKVQNDRDKKWYLVSEKKEGEVITGKHEFLWEIRRRYLPYIEDGIDGCFEVTLKDDYLSHDHYWVYVFNLYPRGSKRKENLIIMYDHYIQQHGWKRSLPVATAYFFKELGDTVKQVKYHQLTKYYREDLTRRQLRRLRRRLKRIFYWDYKYFMKKARQLKKEGGLILKY